MSVAPHVGAWIETTRPHYPAVTASVAPHVGAWIETWEAATDPRAGGVAPHVGAWIETFYCYKVICPTLLSRPTWARGLKHDARKMLSKSV